MRTSEVDAIETRDSNVRAAKDCAAWAMRDVCDRHYYSSLLLLLLLLLLIH
jgi:hypothetical protein